MGPEASKANVPAPDMVPVRVSVPVSAFSMMAQSLSTVNALSVVDAAVPVTRNRA